MRQTHKFLQSAMVLLLTAIGGMSQPVKGIQVKGSHLVKDNRPYYFIGTNMWYAGLLPLQGATGKKRLAQELGFLRQKGITNIRVLLGAEGEATSLNGVRPVHPALQPRQGVYNDTVFNGLDYLLTQLDKYGIKAVFFFSNNWEWSGGFLQYLVWNGRIDEATAARKLSWDEYRDDVSRFYDCTACMDAYHKYVRSVLLHTNRLTGKKYADEPAIMAWEVANEPRPMRPSADSAYTAFLRGTTALIKSIDKKHLVTLGAEGIMGTESATLYETVHRDKNVDYCTIHIWPKNWQWFKGTAIADSIHRIIARGDDYIQSHAVIAERIGKPLVIEEFGLPRDGHAFDQDAATSLRDTWYKAVFARLEKSAREGGVLAGVSFWAFGGEARPVAGQVYWKEGDALMGDPPMEEQGLNAVFDSDSSTWKIISSATQKIKIPYDKKGGH